MIYKFDDINGGLEIVDPVVRWTYAGFDIEGLGKLYLTVELKTDSATFKVNLSTQGQATDRSDEAINELMNNLLAPYVV